MNGASPVSTAAAGSTLSTSTSTSISYCEPAAFDALVAELLKTDAAVDRTTLYLRAERSDFLRFNEAALRQATSVQQAHATIAVERGRRRAESTVTLGGDTALDVALLHDERRALIAQLALIADDPWLQSPPEATSSQRDDRGRLPDADRVVGLVHRVAGERLQQDFVGFYAAGPVARAFADSRGSRHWHRIESFHFSWCLYQRADKAVKSVYAGREWDDAAFVARVEEGATRVPLLALPSRRLGPGAYRAAFSPSAMVELIGMLGWSGFSLRARRTGTSSLMRLVRGEAFAEGMRIDEAFADGIAPSFTPEGYLRPERIALVDNGRLPASGGTLNSPRSAAEYAVATNGVGAHESPDALRLAGGTIPDDRLLETLDTGLYVSNLWYLNYSDRAACRMTGMTRFACFWVEGGKPVAPVDVMRFDDDAFRLFGAGLVGLTATPEFTPNSDTYGGRQLSSVTTPGAVVEGFVLTL
jgi:predicted Zn-dependent protease